MIRYLNAAEPLPWALLLDADPEEALVRNYLATSQLLVFEEDQQILGEVVFQLRETEAELMNVAVTPSAQGKGIGKQLVQATLKELQQQITKPTEVLVKTGDITGPAVGLYKSCGFQEKARVENYFVHHYSEPIYEDGVRLKHQLILNQWLTPKK